MALTIGFTGLGAMGSLMADNLLQAGHRLQVWNRTASRCEPLIARGARACATPADAARGTDFVVSMLADDPATAEVMLGPDGVLAGFAGQAIIDCSTNSPAMARQVGQAAQQRGLVYIDAPVSGTSRRHAGASWSSWWVARQRACRPVPRSSRPWDAWCGTWDPAVPAPP